MLEIDLIVEEKERGRGEREKKRERCMVRELNVGN